MSCATFSITGTNERVILAVPETVGWGEDQDISLMDFWTNVIAVHAVAKAGETITLNGTYAGTADASTSTAEYEANKTGNLDESLWANQYFAQTILIGNSGTNEYHRITGIGLQSKVTITCYNEMGIYLRNTLTGEDLSSGTISHSVFPVSEGYVNIYFDSSYLVAPNSSYAVVMVSTASLKKHRVVIDTSNVNPYAGGTDNYSIDGGLSWDVHTDYDQHFYIIGYRDETPSAVFEVLDRIVNNGEGVTVAGFDNGFLDTTWVISSYSYTAEAGVLNVARWSITLEKT